MKFFHQGEILKIYCQLLTRTNGNNEWKSLNVKPTNVNFYTQKSALDLSSFVTPSPSGPEQLVVRAPEPLKVIEMFEVGKSLKLKETLKMYVYIHTHICMCRNNCLENRDMLAVSLN